MLCVKPDSIGALVKQWREASGLGQGEFARLAKVSYQNIQNLERGDVDRPRYIDKLAKAMGCTTDDILALKMPQPLDRAVVLAEGDAEREALEEAAPSAVVVPASAATAVLSPDAHALAVLFDRLPAEARRAVFAQAVGLIQRRMVEALPATSTLGLEDEPTPEPSPAPRKQRAKAHGH